MRFNIPSKFRPMPVYHIPGSTVPEIVVATIPPIVFYYSDSGTQIYSSIVSYISYTGSETLNYQLSGTLPSAITFANGVFTCVPSGITGAETINVNVQISAIDVASTAIVPITLNTSIATDYSTLPITFESVKDNNSITLNRNGNPYSNTFYYSMDGGATWSAYTPGTEIALASGETVSFSGTSEHFCKDSSNYYYFTPKAAYSSDAGLAEGMKVYGNIMSLVNSASSVTDNGQFNKSFLFSSNADLRDYNLYDASNLVLPSTSLTSGCFRNMFNRSTGLQYTPKLPATELATACYSLMFQRASTISSVILLPATTLANNCYTQLFQEAFFPKAIEVKFTSWGSGNSQYTSNWWYGTLGYSENSLFIKPESLPISRTTNTIPTGIKILNRIDGRLYYAENTGGHSAGDLYQGEDPFANY